MTAGVPRSGARARPVVVKFGGASLEEPDGVCARIRSVLDSGSAPVVVLSARSGVTDALQRALQRPTDGDGHVALLAELERRHAPALPSILERIEDLRALFGRLERSHRVTPNLASSILAAGERLSVRWMSHRLRTSGIEATWFDADRLGLIIEWGHDGAHVLVESSKLTAPGVLREQVARGGVPLVTGYFGLSPEGGVRTLTRGGSDLSAVVIASLLRSPCAVLIKRSGPLRSGDPAWFPDAPILRLVGYRDAVALGRGGARLLYPEAIEFSRRHRIELRLGGLDPDAPETIIGPDRRAPRIAAVTSAGGFWMRVLGRNPLSMAPMPVSGKGFGSWDSSRLVLRASTVSGESAPIFPDPHELRGAAQPESSTGADAAGPRAVALVTYRGQGLADWTATRHALARVDGDGLRVGSDWTTIVVPQEDREAVTREIYERLALGPSNAMPTPPPGRTPRRANALSGPTPFAVPLPGTHTGAARGKS